MPRVSSEWARLTAWGLVRQLPWSNVGVPVNARRSAWGVASAHPTLSEPQRCRHAGGSCLECVT